MIKLITGYGDYSPDDLAHLGETVAANILTIAILATLKPTSAEIAAASKALRDALVVLGPSRAQAVESAFDALAALLANVATNAPQIPNITDTDLAAIGLPQVKTRTRETTPPPAVQNVRLFHGANPGEMDAKCDSLGPNIRLYMIQWTLDPINGTWTDGPSASSTLKLALTGLPRGKDIWVRVRARNTVGDGPWSDPATIMVT